ncbi:MAG: DUF4870 domain-containing protein [Candidatus Zixiibacteriota bacterium]
MDPNFNISQREIEDGKVLAGVAYLGIIGFLIAYLVGKDNRFVLYHAQQALVVAIGFILSPIPVIGWLLAIFMFVMMIIGLINGFSGKVQPLPLIGSIGFKISLLKADQGPGGGGSHPPGPGV